jgi:hypothetical protein
MRGLKTAYIIIPAAEHTPHPLRTFSPGLMVCQDIQMTYSITASVDKKYITVKVIGNISRQLAIQYNLEAHTLGKELGIDHFLLDFTECKNTDTVLRNYKYVYDDMKDPGINQAARTAMLVSPNDHSHDFIEALFSDTGADVTIFRDPELALWHLLQK